MNLFLQRFIVSSVSLAIHSTEGLVFFALQSLNFNILAFECQASIHFLTITKQNLRAATSAPTEDSCQCCEDCSKEEKKKRITQSKEH